jgi:hypothetical protein
MAQQQLLIEQLQQQQPRVTPAIQAAAVGLTPTTTTTTRVHIPYPCPIPKFSDYVDHHLRSGL